MLIYTQSYCILLVINKILKNSLDISKYLKILQRSMLIIIGWFKFDFFNICVFYNSFPCIPKII